VVRPAMADGHGHPAPASTSAPAAAGRAPRGRRSGAAAPTPIRAAAARAEILEGTLHVGEGRLRPQLQEDRLRVPSRTGTRLTETEIGNFRVDDAARLEAAEDLPGLALDLLLLSVDEGMTFPCASSEATPG